MKKLETTLLLLVLAITLFADEYENYTYKLTQSNSSFEIWTTTPANKIRKSDAVPSEIGSEIKVYCAKNEFEPFQVIIKPTSNANISISMGDFGNGITTEINRVDYISLAQASDGLGTTGDFPDPLFPVANPTSASLNANENRAFWITVYVPNSVKGAANYTANLTIGDITIPVELHVFNFTISETPHVKSQMNFSHEKLLKKYGVSGTGDKYWKYVNNMKQYFIDHRLTPKSVLWSGGITGSGAKPYIDYDCNGTLTDNDGIWGFEKPAERFLDGTGLMSGKFSSSFNNGAGFPSFMAATFKTNNPEEEQRPSSFCGTSRGGTWWNANSIYNKKWFQYISGLQNYLTSKGYIDKAYYYFANEPGDQDDYDAIAWYSQKLKQAAPNLKLMVSEEPKPEIYAHSTYNAKIDIWMPVLNLYDPEVSWQRDAQNEDTWIYFLHGTKPPYFNPITLDHQGVEAKFAGWFLWKYRIRGLGYYSTNNWGKNPWTNPSGYGQNGNKFLLYPPSKDNSNITYGSNGHRFVPSIRFELIRDGLEDYEYLYTLAGNQQPQVNIPNAADTQADKIISGLTSYTRDPEFMYNLRRLIGLKNGGEIATIPDITPNAGHWRSEGNPSNYYINFQDPTGQPNTTSTQTIKGKTYKFFNFDNKDYLQIGCNNYDEELGYGWYAPTDVHWQMKYDQWFDNGNELQKSQIYSDWGRKASFEFDLPNGDYNVTVGIGHRKTYKKQNIKVEGVVFYNNASTSNSCLTKTFPVSIRDKKLTLEMGDGKEYTMLNYIDIETRISTGNNTLEESKDKVIISPNPTAGVLFIETQKEQTAEIFSLQGKVLQVVALKAGKNRVDVSSLSSGVYIIKVDNQSVKLMKK